MDASVIPGPRPGEVSFALRLEHLQPDRNLDSTAARRDAVAMLTALEAQHDGRFVLQMACYPDTDRPEQGSIEIHFITTVLGADGGRPAADRLTELWDDLLDILSVPPRRWEFRSVTDKAEVERVLIPFDASHFAEIARREEPCPPTGWSWSGGLGFGGEPRQRELSRRLWSMWTFGSPSADLRRMATVLLAQEAPVAIRVALAPTSLTPGERDGIEELLMAVRPLVQSEGLSYASLHTLESLLYLRPVFDTRCVVASREPISRALLSAIGHAVSEPTKHGDPIGTPVLSGGYAALRGGVDVDQAILADAFRTMSSGRPVPSLAPSGLERLRRILGPWEAANVFRLPVTDDDFPGVRTLEVPDLEPPVARLPRSGRRVGRLVGYGGKSVLIDAEDRFRHLYISGQTGTGKSTLLLNLALQDIACGDGVAVLDPHGDLVEALLCRIPEERLDDVVLVDPADPVAVVGVNLLEAESPVQEEYVVSELCSMFYALFDPAKSGIVGPRFESWLRQAALLLLANKDEPSSFLDISTLFVDQAVRRHLLTDLRDPILSEFWLGEMSQTSDFHKSEVLGWFRSKFEIFRTSRLVRNVVGQAKSTISFADVLRERRILLVNLSKGLLGEYNSALIGHIVFARLWAAALERASIPMSERSDFFVYIDEFQNVTSDSLPSVLSEARKFRVGLTIANQFFSQVPEPTRDAIMGNVGSRITFRLGPKDAYPFAGWLGQDVDADDLTTLPNHIGIAALTDRGVPLDPLVLRTDPPSPIIDQQRADIARSRSRKQWARPINELDYDFFGRWAHVPGSMSRRLYEPAPEATPSFFTGPVGVSAPTTGPRHSFIERWVVSRLLGRESAELVEVHLRERPTQELIGSITALRRHLNMDLTHAKRLVDGAPSATHSPVPRHIARALRYELGLLEVELVVQPPEPLSEESLDCAPETEDNGQIDELIETMGLSERPRNCLLRAGIDSVGDLVARTESELLGITNFGGKSLAEVQSALIDRGLTLRSSAMNSRVAIDDGWLNAIGLGGLAATDKAALIAGAHAELQTRVGVRISSQMTPDELERFENAQQGGSDGALGVLSETVPDYRIIVERTFQELSDEIQSAAPTVARELT